jgi:hypothetical protein
MHIINWGLEYLILKIKKRNSTIRFTPDKLSKVKIFFYVAINLSDQIYIMIITNKSRFTRNVF